ncbi:sulfatase-like hydrolase/transferase [Dyadobacter fanqingshengii]|uniref:Sulfatase-like hydrolase/transferase n=1 Tax=Dyadobacter fanqingshengii TaxID=2906443 RepID=A0A9X1T9Y1_9BACT|nr:sulfatase-like hydrolase/transferase [Dyadobacter fanqingshengii]MCF0040459.1 sulfatase-like hydrolase/transferase [Dyadobacter fanqingshengii]USJ37799.1 sulfatase-like hydrolase/transferase [Dyadobacter fanqingshengii]
MPKIKVVNSKAVSLLLCLLSLCRFANAQSKPNIIVILADDQGWGDLSINGNANVRTPNIDKIGKEGARFSRFYVAPLCAPTRAGLLTGRYHYRSGVWGVSSSREYMNLDEVTFADLFKKAGYATGAFGKWHNGSQYPYHPNGRGFDEFYGFLSGHYANYFNTMLDHNGEPERSKGYITDDLTDKAIDFIEKNKAQPFVCYIPYNTPHSPFQVPDKYYDRVKARGISQFSKDKSQEEIEVTISALAMCENMDDNVGRVLDKLDQLKLTDNTIVIYLTDNGPNSWRWNGDMKGRKGVADEGGVRVPFLIRWPGQIKPGRIISGNAAYIDLLPTLTDLAGISAKGTKPLDGVSLKPALTGKAAQVPERTLFSSINKNSSVRKGAYLFSGGSLFDLSKDSTQQNDLAAKEPELAKTLSVALEKWHQAMVVNIDTSRWLPVGYQQFPKAVLPSQDAVLHRSKGSTLSYSASAPNSSWIANWNNIESYVTWNVEVNTTGKYQVNVLYTSPEPGDAFTIEFNKSRISGKITDAFDPPLIDSPDRVERKGESYEKEFKTLQVGKVDLQKGRGALKLLATYMKGRKFADIRAVELVLIK